ncbi:MAG TPA: flagellar export protein FliJ [Acidobacteriota bacterium]|nr:flagellar export protein FliJ [Acidobacteriota bacterium]
MKRFKYRLQPLLNVKSHLEKQRQKEHARASEKVMHQKDLLAGIYAERDATAETQKARMIGRISISGLLVCSRYLLKLRRDTLAGIELLRGLEKAAEERRLALVKASKERRIYEKLRERQRAKYFKELARQERNESDEIAGNTFRLHSGKSSGSRGGREVAAGKTPATSSESTS